jgi:O-antigen ligase
MTGSVASMPARLARILSLTLVVGVPLAVWPGIEAPFSSPKLWMLCAGSCALLAIAGARGTLGHAAASAPPWLRWAALAWTGSFAWSGMMAPHVALDSLALGLTGPAWGLGLAASGVTAARISGALASAAGIVATVTLAQWAGGDPFAAAGWIPGLAGGSDRLRMYGTLGNPNFVAAWLAITVPTGIVLTRRLAAGGRRLLAVCSAAGAVLAVAAIAATGSRGGALALAAGLVSLAIFTGVRRAWWLVAAALAASVVVPLVSTARPIAATLAGRLYIWRVALPHALDRPLTGWGPGAFELVYHDWQGSQEPAPDTAGFAGPQQRAHNDYLDALVERGVPGAAATCLLFVAGVMVRRRSRPDDRHVFVAGAAAAMMAAAAVAAVDFPLARPAEIAAVWGAAAVLAIGANDAGAGGTASPTQEKKDAP